MEFPELLNTQKQGPAFSDEVYKCLTLIHRVGPGNHLSNAVVFSFLIREAKKTLPKKVMQEWS